MQNHNKNNTFVINNKPIPNCWISKNIKTIATDSIKFNIKIGLTLPAITFIAIFAASAAVLLFNITSVDAKKLTLNNSWQAKSNTMNKPDALACCAI